MFALLNFGLLSAQDLGNLKTKVIIVDKDSIQLDSLSIIPGSVIISGSNKKLSSDMYSISYDEALIFFDFNKLKISDSLKVTITYRTASINFSKTYFHKKSELLANDLNRKEINRYRPDEFETNFFNYSGLNKSGSISRGITTGNNQDASVNSEFNLQLSGNISPEISISANISDNNIPVQADGTSQHLREFDNIYIELKSKKSILKVGDFEAQSDEGYFMKYTKQLKGLGFETNFETTKKTKIRSSINTAVSKGKFVRQDVAVSEGNQGPYKLSGNNNELYIIILSNSEKIWFNGELLSRGSDKDYTIDYNTGELLFTTKRSITKDSRIIAEFEYSELNFASFAINSNTVIQKKGSEFFLTVYSEHDAKNQSIREDLSDEAKELLRETGDDLSNAFIENAVQLDTFTNDEVLYKIKDTLINSTVYTGIYEQSSDPSVAIFRLGFTYVGENSGNYIRSQNSLNGFVYKWVEPIEGLPQGSWEPVRYLSSPKKKQMVNIGGVQEFKTRSKLHYEFALSNQDNNLFSEKDDGDNYGYALKIGYDHSLLKTDSSKQFLLLGSEFKYIDKRFSPIEQFRETEFIRNWNLNDFLSNQNESFLTVFAHYFKRNVSNIYAESNILNRSNNYLGNRNSIDLNFKIKHYKISANLDYLSSKDTSLSTEFFQYRANAERLFSRMSLGIFDTGEKNVFIGKTNNTITDKSFRFNEWGIYLKTAIDIKRSFHIIYKEREDHLPYSEGLHYVSHAREFTLSGKPLNSKKHRLHTDFSYRNLHIPDTSKIDNISEESIAGSIQYNLTILNGALQSSSFAEHLGGNEPVRDYTYIQVLDGQGYFTWQDFNGNNVKEVNEFVKANFTDEADYIRISLPTNMYEKVYNQKFNQSLVLIPRRLWPDSKGLKGIISLFSNRFSFNMNRKFDRSQKIFSPTISDEGLIALTNIIRNDFQFHLKQTKTKINFIQTKNSTKQLLTNGIDTRTGNQQGIQIRQSIFTFVFFNAYQYGTKLFESEFFTQNNFEIDYLQNISELKYIINMKNDASINFTYKNKNSLSGEESMDSFSGGLEYNANTGKGGQFSIQSNFVNIHFSGEGNTSVSYEILEGLEDGNNYLWSFFWNKQLSSYLQLEVQYSGRKAGENRVIHTGGLNLRAVF